MYIYIYTYIFVYMYIEVIQVKKTKLISFKKLIKLDR